MASSWPSAGDYFPEQASAKKEKKAGGDLPDALPPGGQCQALDEMLCSGRLEK